MQRSVSVKKNTHTNSGLKVVTVVTEAEIVYEEHAGPQMQVAEIH